MDDPPHRGMHCTAAEEGKQHFLTVRGEGNNADQTRTKTF